MKRTPQEPTPNFWGYARNYLHDYLPHVRALAPRSIEAYRISLENYVNYLVTEQHVHRQDISFDHFERPFLKAWLAWMQLVKEYQPRPSDCA